jgi:hypothetical protein
MTNRNLRITYFDESPKALNLEKVDFELKLKRVFDIAINQTSNIDQVRADDTDLIVAFPSTADGESLMKWIQRYENRTAQNLSTIPLLVIFRVGFQTVNDAFLISHASNRYFDIIHPEHLDSLPVRILNLLKIRDHIAEIGRYDATLKELIKKVSDLETQITDGR